MKLERTCSILDFSESESIDLPEEGSDNWTPFIQESTKMLEPTARPKENSSSSTDSFDSYRAPMKHHRTYRRSSSPPLEVLKQTDVVEGADNELLDYGEQEDDHIDYDLYIDLPEVIGFSTQAVPFSFVATEKFTDLPAVNLTPGASSSAQEHNSTEFVGDGDNVIFYVSSASLGASLKGKDGTQENFPADKEDLIPEAVSAIPSEDISVDNIIPSPLSSLPLLAIEQTVVADAEEEDVDDYARTAAKVILSKLFSRFKRTPLDQLHSLSSFVDKMFNLLEGLPLDLFGIKSKVNGVLGKARLLTEARDSNSFDMLHQTVLEKLDLICHEEKLKVQKVDEITSASSHLQAEEIGLCSTRENLEKEISSIEENILSLQEQVVMKRYEVHGSPLSANSSLVAGNPALRRASALKITVNLSASSSSSNAFHFDEAAYFLKHLSFLEESLSSAIISSIVLSPSAPITRTSANDFCETDRDNGVLTLLCTCGGNSSSMKMASERERGRQKPLNKDLNLHFNGNEVVGKMKMEWVWR
ncbi:hypothetical protein CKAN_00155700 [Cinnamomum micranthum f. kanehirae]|uniref:Uncharacterized protein n=1 Tax=Cinnamomum micranthum f. kanehirae TaxID=337451 RepID=A0A3S3MBC3_9MAGN|nr:hypothetical protein CKAN_00155700 [Cinnamomum micranthum f. kanehirae]